MSVLEATLEDTGQLVKIAEEKYRARSRPVDVGPIILTAMLAAVVAFVGFAAADTDRFPIDGTRWVMAGVAVGAAVAAMTVVGYVLDRRSRKRADLLMSMACHNATAIGQLAAQMEQLDQRLGRMAEVLTPEPEQVPSAQVHAMTAEAYRLGRRSRPE